MPNMFGGDQFDELYAPHMHRRTTLPAQPDANPEQGPVTDEENERFSRDVSNFKGANPEATKYALEQFLKNRGPRPAPTPPSKGLFVDLIAKHPGLAEELKAIDDAPMPAQTPPPRLTDETIEDIWMIAREANDFPGLFARAVESAVRKQLGIKDQEGGAA